MRQPFSVFLSKHIKWANVPRFKYDVLNLYGLNQFGFSNEAQIMVRGYDGVPGALAEESTTEDVAVVAFGKVAGVSNLINSDPKLYIRGISSSRIPCVRRASSSLWNISRNRSRFPLAVMAFP